MQIAVAALWPLPLAPLPCLAAPAGVAVPAGVVKVATGTVTLERSSQRIPASVGSLVLPGDKVATGPASTVGITLRDNTMLTAGPDSSLSLRDFA